MGTYFADYHIHSKFSFDSKESIKNIYSRAVEAGLNEICMTEHFSLDEEDSSWGFLDFSKYEEEIYKYQSKKMNNIKVKVGLEIGEGHLQIEPINKYLKKKDIDFIIGSLHNINGLGLRRNILKYSIDKVYEDYFRELYILADKAEYDVIGHLDLIQRYAWDQYGKYEINRYIDLIESILKKVIERGKGIEINTSILKQRDDFMPKIDIVKRYKELGGEIITVGSDSHSSDRLGEGISLSYEFLRDIGFEYVSTFEKRNLVQKSIL
ncbi:MAG: histidinol-phosphatase HisJ family protein [Clostridiaceae bacterium]